MKQYFVAVVAELEDGVHGGQAVDTFRSRGSLLVEFQRQTLFEASALCAKVGPHLQDGQSAVLCFASEPDDPGYDVVARS